MRHLALPSVQLTPLLSLSSIVGWLTEFFNVTSTRIRAYHRVEHRLGRPRRALNTTRPHCTHAQQYCEHAHFFANAHVCDTRKKAAFQRKKARRTLPGPSAPASRAAWRRPPRSCAALAAMTPPMLLQSCLQRPAATVRRMESLIVELTTTPVMLSPSAALATMPKIDAVPTRRTNAAHGERQMGDTGLSREAGGRRAAHVSGQSPGCAAGGCPQHRKYRPL